MPIKLFSNQGIKTLNMKTSSIGELDEFMDWQLNKNLGGLNSQSILQLKARVPWLFRGINIVADKVSEMPFQILDDSNKVIDDTDEWQGALEYTKNIKRILWLVTASLMARGKAYVYPEFNRLGRITGDPSSLRYFNPDTIEPKITSQAGLEVFIRRIPQLQPVEIPKEKLIYFWLPDDAVEIGVPKSYPAQAALSAAGTLFSLDEFFRTYAEKGLVKAFIVSAKGMSDPNERTKMEDYFTRFVQGVRNAFQAKIFNAEAVIVTPVGEGLKEFENVTITQDKREDISVALGVPVTYLWSSQAGGLGGGGVSKEDTFRLYDGTVIPMFRFIVETLNEQFFENLGYRLQDKKESLEVFQEDENARATSLSALKNAGVPLLVAMEILGYDLTDEQRAVIENELIYNKTLVAPMNQQQNENNSQQSNIIEGKTFIVANGGMRDHLDKWKRKALKSLTNGKGANVPFDSDEIPGTLIASISGALESAKDENSIKSIFENASTWESYP